MSGRRVLDLARIYQATKNVAKQHIALRSAQYDVYSNTSTLAKAVKEQTDRVTLTVQAGIVLAKRLAEDSPTTKQWEQSAHDTSSETQQQDGDKRDRQTIDVQKNTPEGVGPVANEPIPAHTDTTSRNASNIKSTGINAEEIIVPKDHRTKFNQQDQDDPPPDVDVNIFRTKRGSSLLSRNAARRPEAVNSSSTEQKGDNASFTESDITPTPEPIEVTESTPAKAAFEMRESRVPSTRFGRLWQYGGLGMSMAFGAVGESLRRSVGGRSADGSVFLSPGNLELLVAKLSKMRGAALKLGQMVSFQGKISSDPWHRDADSCRYQDASSRDPSSPSASAR